MNKDLLMVVEAVSNEKSVDRDKIFEALESAIKLITRKKLPLEADVNVRIDRRKGNLQTFRRWIVVNHVENPEIEILFEKLPLLSRESLSIGDCYEEEIPSIIFDRIAIQQAKQVIIQKVREIERKVLAEKFLSKVGNLFSGIVKEVGKNFITVELSCSTEAVLAREELIAKEIFRVGDRIRAILILVQWEQPGPQLFLSRAQNQMLEELLKIEVPEISQGAVEVKGIARIPGQRSKIAVFAKDQRSDPIGACVGMRGSRIQALSSELNGERIDIVIWAEEPVQYVLNAMSPSEVTSIVMDEDTLTMDLAVSEETFAKSIGRNGQNVRLASQLTGWKINVLEDSAFKKRYADESLNIKTLFIQRLEISEETAMRLIDEGFSSIESIAYIPEEEQDSIQSLSVEEIVFLKKRALFALDCKAAAEEKELKVKLKGCCGCEDAACKPEVLRALLDLKIDSIEKLAEFSVEELESVPTLSIDQKGALIMAAREKSWFQNS